MGKKLTAEDFISKARQKHGFRYDYSLVKYINSNTKIEIICPVHGSFVQVPSKHLFGQGCQKCATNSKKTISDYITEFNKIHSNKYQYKQTEFKTVHSKIEITCPIHGVFFQTINSHKNGNGCPRCYEYNKKSTDTFILDSKLIHGDKYDYSISEYINNNTPIKILCPIHGEFKQPPRSHLSGCGCPSCNQSKGEKYVRELLLQKNIRFIPQHKFKDCRHIKPLPFDFYLPEHNICIEYHGAQHFKPIEHFGGLDYFNIIQKRDKIKEEYCSKNNIQLIIVS